MNLKTVFTLNAIVAGVYGLGLVFAPKTVDRAYMTDAVQAVTSEPASRLLGAYVLSFAILFWFLRGPATSDGKSETFVAVTKALSITYAIGIAVCLFEYARGPLANTVWLSVAIYAVFGVMYAYFGFSDKGRNASA